MADASDYDVVVVGGGIAGLCIAELFARCGRRIALIERNARLCMEASGAHHGWFHFGSLYSIFPNNQFMRTLVGGVDDLIAYYNAFPGMNIRVGQDGKLTFPKTARAWIRDEPVQYIVAARNDRDFDLHVYDGLVNYAGKLFFTLTWDLAIKQFISRHQRFHKFDWRRGPASEHIPRAGWMDYSRDVIFKPVRTDYDLDPDTHFRVPGFDRPMNPGNIATDLLRSLIGAGSTLLTGCAYAGYIREGDTNLVQTSGGTLRAKHVVLATGRALHKHAGPKLTVNVVASPLLVAYPAVSETNFARLTPFVSKTVNHLRHYVNAETYSLIGGGYAAPAGDETAIAQVEQDLLEAATRIFPRLSEARLKKTYVSYKTEISAQVGERNYQYLMKDLSEDVVAVVPGKFSLGFSLAVNLYKKLYGETPAAHQLKLSDGDVSRFLGPMRHEQAVADQIAGERRAAAVG